MLVENEKDLRINQLKLIVIIMVVLSVIMTSFTVFWLIDYSKVYGDYSAINAKVVEQKEVEGIVYDVFEYKVNKNIYKVTSDWKSSHSIGDEVKLYYDENNHLSITESLDSRRISLPIISGIFLIICIALIITYIVIYYSNRRTKLLAILREQEVETDETESNDIEIVEE